MPKKRAKTLKAAEGFRTTPIGVTILIASWQLSRRVMVKVNLKGIAKVTAKGRTYWYAWRGGPRLRGEPGSLEFIQSFNEALDDWRAPSTSRFRGVVVAYKASPEWQNLSAITRKNWAPWLDRISDYFGELRIVQFNRPEKIQPIIRKWRYKWAATPRTADQGMQVLSRVLSYAIDPLGKIGSNPCVGIKHLYKGGDRAEIIWTDRDIDAIKAGKPGKPCPDEISWAIDLARHTGLRKSDLIRVSWSHIGDDAICFPTGKSRGRVEVLIPLYPALRDVLGRIPKRATTILTNSLYRPWTASGIDDAVRRAKNNSAIADRDLHLHDLRGTAATTLYLAKLDERVIAEILGWEQDAVRKIIRKYVGRSAATKAIIRQINERGT
jgi:integrase